MERYEDPNDLLNSAEHYSGKSCIETGCSRQAGTAWSPHWCQQCNAVRMKRIGANLRGLLNHNNQQTEGT